MEETKWKDRRADFEEGDRKEEEEAIERDGGDDGRVIFNMNVEGMPGYRPDLDRLPDRSKNLRELLSANETWQIIKASWKAAFFVASVFSAVIIVFVLFCVFIWFA